MQRHRYRWNKQELNTLIKNYGQISTKELAKQLERSPSGLREKVRDIGLKHPTTWTKAEINELKKLYPTTFSDELATKLNKTVTQIQYKATKLGLRKKIDFFSKKNRRPLKVVMTETELAYLAGIIDGEGTIGLRTQKQKGKNRRISLTPYISIANNRKDLFVWVKEKISNITITEHSKNSGHWMVQITGRRIKPLLEGLLPHLLVKKRMLIYY